MEIAKEGAEQADKEKAEKEKMAKEKMEKENAEKEKAKKELTPGENPAETDDKLDALVNDKPDKPDFSSADDDYRDNDDVVQSADS